VLAGMKYLRKSTMMILLNAGQSSLINAFMIFEIFTTKVPMGAINFSPEINNAGRF
jgi:hypothetical protein